MAKPKATQIKTQVLERHISERKLGQLLALLRDKETMSILASNRSIKVSW